jgi:hypothetical protein
MSGRGSADQNEAGRTRLQRRVIASLLGAVVVLGTGIVLSFELARETQDLMNSINVLTDAEIIAKDRVELIRNALQYRADNLTKLWTVIAAALVGYVGWLNFRVVQQNLEETKRKMTADREASDANLRIAQEAQITNRFTQAIGQLGAELKNGDPNLEVRLGGIYALERIARDSPRDHWTIMEILTAYVRQNAPWPPAAASDVPSWVEQPLESMEMKDVPNLREDVQAILTVLGRRVPAARRVTGSSYALSTPAEIKLRMTKSDRLETGWLDLHMAALRKAYLVRAHLEEAFLQGTHLEGANLGHASLAGIYLKGANLQEANLWHANLQGANLELADLKGATFDHADLRAAKELNEDQLKLAKSWVGAQLPENLSHLAYAVDKPADFLAAPPVTPPAAPASS